jgi:hypothetical protein
MKPDWKYAPWWARYLVRDANGAWWWYENKPIICGKFGWTSSGGHYIRAHLIDWCDSLEERPVHKSSFDYHAEGIKE